MINLLAIPYPRKPLVKYFGIVIAIGLLVNFILMVFQPFGTASFRHPNKMMILAGYGITIALSGMLYYIMSYHLFKRNGEKEWNIISEITDLFLCVVLSMVATYFYYKLVFGGELSIRTLLDFLGLAGSVAFLPVLLSLVYLYYTWKDVVPLTATHTTAPSNKNSQITLIAGQNKSDQVETDQDDLICISAQDNYVMLFIRRADKVKKYLLRSTLKKIYAQLDSDRFVQAHRSHIVNKYQIKGLIGNKSKAAIILSDFEKNIPVSRAMYDEIKILINS